MMSNAVRPVGAFTDTSPFPESGARRWFHHDDSAWASNGHFAVRLPWSDIGGESFDETWRELRDPGALFALPFDFSAIRYEDGTDVDAAIVKDDGTSIAGKVHAVRRYGRVVLARVYIDAIHAMWPEAQARFSLANNTAHVAFVYPPRDGLPNVVGLVAPRRGRPNLWVEPEEAQRVADLAYQAASQAAGTIECLESAARDLRAIANRVLGGGAP